MTKANNIEKILFITLSNIGDVILTIPTLLRLSKKYKNAKFDIVGDERSKILFKHCPLVNNFFVKDKSKGFIGVLRLINKLRFSRYDVAIDLRSDGLLYLIRADRKFYKIKNNAIHSSEKHYLALKEPLVKALNPKIWLSQEERKNAENLLPNKYKSILVFGLGANSQHKVWPTHFYAELANRLGNRFDLLVLVGDSKDNKLLPSFIQNYKRPLLNLSGKVDLLTTAAILEKAELFIGNDSGLGHIASAVKTKTFTIFGPGEPKRYRPCGDNAYWYQNKQKKIEEIKPLTIYKAIESKFDFRKK